MIELLIILIIGIFLIYIAFKTSEKTCPPPRVEYRFIPRTLKEEIENPVKVSEIFDSMFNSPTVFLGRDIGNRQIKSDNINTNFISQN